MRNIQVRLSMVLGGVTMKNLRFIDIYILVPFFYVAGYFFFFWAFTLSPFTTSWTDLRWHVAFICPSEKRVKLGGKEPGRRFPFFFPFLFADEDRVGFGAGLSLFPFLLLH